MMAETGQKGGENGIQNPAFESDGRHEFSKIISTATPFPNSDAELTSELKKEKFAIFKNVVIISISFIFLFTSFQSMANLQSSINSEEGLGTYSLSVLYGALVISCCFVPSILINSLTVKWTLVVSQLSYSLYILAQFYPTFATLIPSAIILGIGAAPMWSAKCTYLTHVGHKYAEIFHTNAEVMIVRFFGIFFLAFQSSNIWGNLISSAVLGSGTNSSTFITEEELELCGIEFCPDYSVLKNKNLERPSKSKIYTLASVYLICSLVAAAIVALLVDPLTRWGEKDRVGMQGKTGLQLIGATFNHVYTNRYQQLIIPLTFWSGVEQGFFGSEFTRAYVSCAYGTANIGYVLICYGVCDAICSISFGPLIKLLGRIPIFLFGSSLNVVAFFLFFFWRPHPDDAIMFFVIAGLWGIADAVWQTQINAFYGVLFPQNEEAAFSNYRLWESLGFILAYVLNNVVCVRTHAWVVVAVLVCGMVGYLIIEVLERFNPQIKTEQNTQNGHVMSNQS